MLLAMPWVFHGWSTGWTLPAASAARASSSYVPGTADQRHVHRDHTHRPNASSTAADCQLRPPSVDTSTALTGARPDHARPTSSCSPADTKRVRDMKSGYPG